MSNIETIRIGVVGAGANTRLMHIPGFQAIEGVSVDVVRNRSEASSQKVADEFGIPRIASSWQEVVADPELDAVCIGTWPYMHAPVAIESLKQGKHVLTEARMAMNANEAAEMLQVSEEADGLVAQIVPSPFTLKWDETIKDILAAGALGTLREVCFFKSLPINADGSSPLNWRQDSRYSGHNIMMLGIYYEVAQRWLGIEPEAVWACGDVFTPSRKDQDGASRDIEIPETLLVSARYASGLRLQAHMSGIERGEGRDMFVVNGSEGTLRLDLLKKELKLCMKAGGESLGLALKDGQVAELKEGSGESIIEPGPSKAGSWQVEADFIASIREGKPVTLTNFQDGLAYMKFTDAVYASAKQGGEWVQM